MLTWTSSQGHSQPLTDVNARAQRPAPARGTGAAGPTRHDASTPRARCRMPLVHRHCISGRALCAHAGSHRVEPGRWRFGVHGELDRSTLKDALRAWKTTFNTYRATTRRSGTPPHASTSTTFLSHMYRMSTVSSFYAVYGIRWRHQREEYSTPSAELLGRRVG